MHEGSDAAAETRGGRVLGSLREFLHDEAIGGVVLLAATVVALAWANFAEHSYEEFWHHTLTLGSGEWAVTEDIAHWVNDGLMVIFFFVVGLEIKRELVVGELRRPRTAALPAIAAVGGAVLPALVFLLLAPGGEARHGWGIPMATDIAFAVGMLALLGKNVSNGAKLFLLSVAIVDDLIAIVVIAIFYTEDLLWGWLLVALLAIGVIVVMRRFVASPWAYVLPGVIVWLGFLESGVHATLAGVVLGLLTPAEPVRGRPVLHELEHALHPVSVFVVVPIFALANAGLVLGGGALSDAFGERLTWAIAVGLVVGKLFGITAATWLALRLRLGTLPSDMSRREIWPVAALGGIGFTVALFITDLAYDDELLIENAKVGVFTGSIIAALLGALLLRTITHSPAEARTADG